MLKILTRATEKTKRSWTYTRENGVDSPYLFLHCVFSIDASPNYILSRKKTIFFEKINQTHSILLQFTQDLHLLIAYHQTKTLISRFFLLMPPFLRNGSFLFVLQSQPFYQAQLVPVTTISTLRSSLARG